MIEVEVKVAVSNTKALEEKLIFLGFLKGKKLRESDTYFDNAVQTFRPVVKTRQYYSKSDITVCLDQVEGLGDFFEVEKIVESDADRVGALEEIFYLLEGLGFKKEQVIRTSYLSMLQAKI